MQWAITAWALVRIGAYLHDAVKASLQNDGNVTETASKVTQNMGKH
jgi:HD superfamily phosphodiesterase